MLTWENCVEAQALRTRGWSISAIANHLGHDRKTIRAYLNGERRPGGRKPARSEAMSEFLDYCRQRLTDDPHLWSTTLYDEVVDLGFTGSYQAFTASIRKHELRPRCAACAAAKHKDRSVVEHPPGEETQWDWLELPDPPQQWGFGDPAHLLLGVLPHSSRWRGWIAEGEDQPHLIEGLHQVATRLGGLTARWRFDRMATVCHPGSGRITASFGPAALHYRVGIAICPSKHAWRKGAVEKSAHTIAQRWWRTVADDVTVAAAQASLDRVCVTFDARTRTRDGVRTTVGELADAEPLRAMPAPFPAVIEVERTVSNQALLAFRGNRYSVLPGHAGEVVTVRHRLGTTTLDVVDRHGTPLAHHVRQPDGAGARVRLDEHVTALSTVVLATFSDREPCRGRPDGHPAPRRWPKPTGSTVTALGSATASTSSSTSPTTPGRPGHCTAVPSRPRRQGSDERRDRAEARTLAQHAEAAEQAVRALNHRTRPAAGELTDPAETAEMIATLAVLAGMLPQLLDQLGCWLLDQHHAGRLRVDRCTPMAEAGPRHAVHTTATALAHAAECTRRAGHALDTAHQHAAHLAVAVDGNDTERCQR